MFSPKRKGSHTFEPAGTKKNGFTFSKTLNNKNCCSNCVAEVFVPHILPQEESLQESASFSVFQDDTSLFPLLDCPPEVLIQGEETKSRGEKVEYDNWECKGTPPITLPPIMEVENGSIQD